MFKRWLTVLLLFLVVPWIASAQHLGAVVVSHDYDAAKNMVTPHMLNQSGKDITAYNVMVKETYSTGQVHEHQTGAEMIARMLLIADPPDAIAKNWIEKHPDGNGTWQAGTTRDQLVGLQPGLNLKTFEATIDTVIYADRTAETTNPDGLKRLLDGRKGYASMLEAGSKTTRDALDDPNDTAPHKTARKKMEAGEVALDLENAPAMAERAGKPLRDYLSDMAAHKSHRAQLMREHTNVTVGGAK